jgi:hypothetical protein
VAGLVAELSAYLEPYLPGGCVARSLREALLARLAAAPVDPRVPGGREAVWCALVSGAVQRLEVEGAGLSLSRYMTGEGVSFVNNYSAVGSDMLLMLAGLGRMARSEMKVLTVRNLEPAALEPLTRLLGPARFPRLKVLTLASTDYSVFVYRTRQVS